MDPFGGIFDHVSSQLYGITTVGGGFKYFLFSPLFGEDFQFD